jgi:outer membrane protein assembly factor BamB
MKRDQFLPFTVSILAICLLTGTMSLAADGQWTQWGGPDQDFKAHCDKLADTWPDAGPKKIWSRDLGDGYSAIIAEDGKLYTMLRDGDQEAVICLDAKSGKTLWETKYDAQPAPGHVVQFGTGPRGTPMINGERVYAIGVSGVMHCLNKKTGDVQWKQDLWKEFGGTVLQHGYSSSPFVYKRTVIAMVGGKEHSLVAFNKWNGKVVWKKQDFDNSYSTPKLINVDGQDQLVCFMANEVAGIDPSSGDLLWSFKHGNQYKQNVCMPIYSNDDHIMFISSAADGGSRGLKLTKDGDKTTVKEVWNNKKVGIHHSNAFRVGDYVYLSTTSGNGPGLFYALNAKTGEVAWRERGFSKATCLYADGKVIILDEDGNLGLAVCTPKEFDVKSQVPMMERSSWTVPTLVGDKLFVRDRKHIVALDLSASSS